VRHNEDKLNVVLSQQVRWGVDTRTAGGSGRPGAAMAHASLHGCNAAVCFASLPQVRLLMTEPPLPHLLPLLPPLCRRPPHQDQPAAAGPPGAPAAAHQRLHHRHKGGAGQHAARAAGGLQSGLRGGVCALSLGPRQEMPACVLARAGVRSAECDVAKGLASCPQPNNCSRWWTSRLTLAGWRLLWRPWRWCNPSCRHVRLPALKRCIASITPCSIHRPVCQDPC
jgi:hypothetical protein